MERPLGGVVRRRRNSHGKLTLPDLARMIRGPSGGGFLAEQRRVGIDEGCLSNSSLNRGCPRRGAFRDDEARSRPITSFLAGRSAVW